VPPRANLLLKCCEYRQTRNERGEVYADLPAMTANIAIRIIIIILIFN